MQKKNCCLYTKRADNDNNNNSYIDHVRFAQHYFNSLHVTHKLLVDTTNFH